VVEAFGVEVMRQGTPEGKPWVSRMDMGEVE